MKSGLFTGYATSHRGADRSLCRILFIYFLLIIYLLRKQQT